MVKVFFTDLLFLAKSISVCTNVGYVVSVQGKLRIDVGVGKLSPSSKAPKIYSSIASWALVTSSVRVEPVLLVYSKSGNSAQKPSASSWIIAGYINFIGPPYFSPVRFLLW